MAPIKSVSAVDGDVTFSLEWMALKGLRGGWKRHPGDSLMAPASTMAEKNDDGCWKFYVAYVGSFIIFLEGDNLDPSRVEGLEHVEVGAILDVHVAGGITPENMDSVDEAAVRLAPGVVDGTIGDQEYDDADFPDG